MSGKVIHISDSLHRRLTEYCRSRNLKMTDFVSELVLNRIQPTPVVKKEEVPETPAEKPVAEKSLVESKESPWESKPFWKKDPSCTPTPTN